MLATALCRRAFAGLDKLTDEDRAALFLIRALHAALELRKEIRRANVVQGHRRSRDEKNTNEWAQGHKWIYCEDDTAGLTHSTTLD